MTHDPLQSATHRFYFKPPMAFFQAFVLRGYQTAGVELPAPVLDLGCDDGVFGASLRDLGTIPDGVVGADFNRAILRQTRRTTGSLHTSLVGCDARQLPFESGSFQSVVANAMLCCINPGTTDAIREIARVLRTDGELICTVPTDRWRQGYLGTRLLQGLGLERLAEAYTARMERRCTHFFTVPAEEWVDLIEEGGFRVQRVVGFFPETLVAPWNVTALTPLRALSILRLLPSEPVQRLAGNALRALMAGIWARTPKHSDPKSCGYVLIHATRA